MKVWKIFAWIICGWMVAACSRKEPQYEIKEIGYKGTARVNPWLAAERFVERQDLELVTSKTWRPPSFYDSVWVVPAHVVANDSFVKQLDLWVANGGHLVCLIDHTYPGSDWISLRSELSLERPFEKWMKNRGISLSRSGEGSDQSEKVEFRGQIYQIGVSSGWRMGPEGKQDSSFVSTKYGRGRLSILADAKPFRNRWIAEKDHAAFLSALISTGDRTGAIVWVKGAPLSLWTLLWERAWTVLIGVAVVIGVLLWKNLPRFGPLAPVEEPSPLRGYDHHLEALGDFQWRLDKGASMLSPIRAEIIERAQRFLIRTGQQDGDIFQILGDRANIPAERARRALVEPAPADGFIFTRTVSDLQGILQNLP